ncbi:hypothetical protein Y032_1070g3533 [Ancylostoma ceylanicum]|uniref:Uncharacterized protein n=1 Tax=Ancylostoma ceylanicum TaxID=53326 RepID=A0A016W7U4_9BILA|nr:hypothetical protein Y032_1070g3533 [Ancylostoma ceylanicum]
MSRFFQLFGYPLLYFTHIIGDRLAKHQPFESERVAHLCHNFSSLGLLMQLMFTVITVTPLLVISLRCYHGSEGMARIPTVDVGEGKMCVYETMRPCKFKDFPGDRSNYRAAPYVKDYAKKCFNKNNRAICYCQSELCNGNFKLILERWENTTHSNKTQYECVREYLKNKKDLYYPAPTVEKTTKQGKVTTKIVQPTTKPAGKPTADRETIHHQPSFLPDFLGQIVTTKIVQPTTNPAGKPPQVTQKTTVKQATKIPVPQPTTKTTPKANSGATTFPVKIGPTTAGKNKSTIGSKGILIKSV